MIWDAVRGHEQQVVMFRRSLQRNRLSHAYLFLGEDGIGKRRFALTLAQCLLCQTRDDTLLDACRECAGCRQMQAGTHPDFFLVAPPPGKRDLSIELLVGTPEQRGRAGLCYELSLKPMAGSRKIAVIDQANLMNDASANALLKTLEEPPAGALIILIGTSAEGILPTIRSRCQQIRFAPLNTEDVRDLLLAQGQVSDADEATVIAELSQGSLSVAEQLLDPGIRNLREQLQRALASPRRFNAAQCAKQVVETLDALSSDAAAQRRNAGWIVAFVVEFLRCAVRQQSGIHGPGPETLVQSFLAEWSEPEPFEALAEMLERTLDCERQLRNAMSVPLCLEALFDALGQRLRGPATIR